MGILGYSTTSWDGCSEDYIIFSVLSQYFLGISAYFWNLTYFFGFAYFCFSFIWLQPFIYLFILLQHVVGHFHIHLYLHFKVHNQRANTTWTQTLCVAWSHLSESYLYFSHQLRNKPLREGEGGGRPNWLTRGAPILSFWVNRIL